MKWHAGLKTYLRVGQSIISGRPCCYLHGTPRGALMAEELNKDEIWEKEQVLSFNSIAKNYVLNG